MFKISLPDPMELEAETFFSQMKIVLKATQKAYEEATKNLTKEEKENFYITFRLPDLWNDYDNKVKNASDFIDGGIESHIELEINN